MIPEKKFCKGCGQALNANPLLNLVRKKSYEFEDGEYCEACAREKVESRRRQLKNR